MKLQTRKVLRCWKELEGWKELGCWLGSLDCWMAANIELEKSYSFILHRYDGPSSSLRKSVENAHALIVHTYGIMSPIRWKLQWVRVSLVLQKSILYSYAHNKGTYQTALMRIQIRILVVRCSDNLFIEFCMPNSTLRRAAETQQAVVVLPRHNNNSFIRGSGWGIMISE